MRGLCADVAVAAVLDAFGGSWILATALGVVCAAVVVALYGAVRRFNFYIQRAPPATQLFCSCGAPCRVIRRKEYREKHNHFSCLRLRAHAKKSPSPEAPRCRHLPTSVFSWVFSL